MIDSSRLLKDLPKGLRDPLIGTYKEIARNFSERRWEPAELNGGKLCEVVYSIIDGATSGKYPAAPKKPQKMADACRAIEQRAQNPSLVGDRSFRVLIPRLLPYLYDIRNNRGVGHVGGDVTPNAIDAAAVFSMSNWVVAELIRIFHGVSLAEAQLAIEALVERKHPLVWEIDGTKRVLDPTMSSSDQVLVLLYSTSGWSSESAMRAWVEYKNASDFRRRILEVLHKARQVEYDRKRGLLRLTPLGVAEVENRIIATTTYPRSV